MELKMDKNKALEAFANELEAHIKEQEQKLLATGKQISGTMKPDDPTEYIMIQSQESLLAESWQASKNKLDALYEMQSRTSLQNSKQIMISTLVSLSDNNGKTMYLIVAPSALGGEKINIGDIQVTCTSSLSPVGKELLRMTIDDTILIGDQEWFVDDIS